jgi:G:T/U-mismatch repair DNA glycosylase
MMSPEYLRKHIDALLRLSHDVKDKAVSAKLREMADECRIMLSVADVSELAAGLSKAPDRLRGNKRH